MQMHSKRSIPKCVVVTFGLSILWLGINFKQMIEKKREKETSNIEFDKWINNTVGDLAQRRRRWTAFINQEAKRSRRKRLPDLIGIGVRKCGTGAIQYFLNHHPLVHAILREPTYFSKKRNEGLDYYKSLLPAASESQIVAEKSPSYFASKPENLPEIINQQVPGVKIWITLCDPVVRAFSDFAMRRRKAQEQIDEDLFENQMKESLQKIKRSFSAKGNFTDFFMKIEDLNVSKEGRKLFSDGLYAIIMKRWLKVFPPDRFLIIDGDELFQNPGFVIGKFQEFLHIPRLLLQKDFVRHPKTGLYCVRPYWKSYDFAAEYRENESWGDNLHCLSSFKGSTRSRNASYRIPERLKLVLENFYRPYNSMLYNLHDRKFLWQ